MSQKAKKFPVGTHLCLSNPNVTDMGALPMRILLLTESGFELLGRKQHRVSGDLRRAAGQVRIQNE
jgi:hypothetical protein